MSYSKNKDKFGQLFEQYDLISQKYVDGMNGNILDIYQPCIRSKIHTEIVLFKSIF